MGFVAVFLKFMSEIAKVLLAVLTGFIKWCREHPKRAIALAVVLVAMVVTWWVTDWYVTRKVKAEDAKIISALQVQIKKANDDARARDDKAKRIEKDSKVAADQFEADTTASKARMKELVAGYEKKLAAEKKNKILIVRVPVSAGSTTTVDVPVEVNTNNEVVCRRFHESFRDTVNEMIKETNTGAAK